MLLLTLRETYALNRLPSFKNLRRKGGKFDHRPGRPKVLLRHWLSGVSNVLDLLETMYLRLGKIVVSYSSQVWNVGYYGGCNDTAWLSWNQDKDGCSEVDECENSKI